MVDVTSAVILLSLFAAAFAAVGVRYGRKYQDKFDDFLVARDSQNSRNTLLTLMATTMGTWVLFGPAESATWGGIGAVLGYALGVLVPRLIMIPLGGRIRILMPEGRTLTEFVYNRYGRSVYGFVLVIMLFYLFIGLTAGLTGVAQLVAIISPVPLWLTATIVLVTTLIYTLHGGLRVTIFTDRLQMFIILPFIALLIGFGWMATDGISPALTGLQQNAPHLLDPLDASGLQTGLTFFIAVVLTGLFYQGTWQRVYAARDNKVVRNAFVLSGLLSFPIIVIMGLFGLAFVGLGLQGTGTTALFNVILDTVPYWFVLGIIPFGLALIMSSADSGISGLNSILVVDLHRLMPSRSGSDLLKMSRWLILLMCLPILYVASQGFSILYLFLLADLLCCAAAFPVFFGFYSSSYQNYNAALSITGGLIGGFYFFPMPGEPITNLLQAFLSAALIPVAISLLLMAVPNKRPYDFQLLRRNVCPIEQ